MQRSHHGVRNRINDRDCRRTGARDEHSSPRKVSAIPVGCAATGICVIGLSVAVSKTATMFKLVATKALVPLTSNAIPVFAVAPARMAPTWFIVIVS